MIEKLINKKKYERFVYYEKEKVYSGIRHLRSVFPPLLYFKWTSTLFVETSVADDDDECVE